MGGEIGLLISILAIVAFVVAATQVSKRLKESNNKRMLGRARSLLAHEFVVVDLETTGLDCEKYAMIEIGAIKVTPDLMRGTTTLRDNLECSRSSSRPRRPVLWPQACGTERKTTMNQYIILRIVTLLMLLATVSHAGAQGTAFTYQGRLNDGANPANGTYDLRFAIYDSANGPGSIVAGPLTSSAIAVNNGVFTVTLDFGAGVFTGASRWLEIGVNLGGGAFVTLSPRQAITPVPYATYALTPPAGVALLAAQNTFSSKQTFAGQIHLNSADGFSQSSLGQFDIDAPGVAGGRFTVLTDG